ncbi:MAG TPA: hypothetical protein PLH22_02180 [Candidatus Colwellbacteria bacterium]|nr:hypothetical protein [Candidatus Colwellbacteria bacterium]
MRRNIIIILSVVLLVAAGVAFYFFGGRSRETETLPPSVSVWKGKQLVADYFEFLIEGAIQNISAETSPATITIAVKLPSIFVDPDAETADVVCELKEDAEIVFYDLSTREETSVTLADLNVLNQVVAELDGITNVSVLDGERCVIRKIRRILSFPGSPAE